MHNIDSVHTKVAKPRNNKYKIINNIINKTTGVCTSFFIHKCNNTDLRCPSF